MGKFGFIVTLTLVGSLLVGAYVWLASDGVDWDRATHWVVFLTEKEQTTTLGCYSKVGYIFEFHIWPDRHCTWVIKSGEFYSPTMRVDDLGAWHDGTAGLKIIDVDAFWHPQDNCLAYAIRCKMLCGD